MNRHLRKCLFLSHGSIIWCVTLAASATDSDTASGAERARILTKRAQAQWRLSHEEIIVS